MDLNAVGVAESLLCVDVATPNRVRSTPVALDPKGYLCLGATHALPLRSHTPVLRVRIDERFGRDVLVVPVGGELGGFVAIAAETDALGDALAATACVLVVRASVRELTPHGLVPPSECLPLERLSSQVHSTCQLLQSASLLGAATASAAALRLAGTVRPQVELRDSPLLEAQLRHAANAVRAVSALSLGAAALLVDGAAMGTWGLLAATGCAWHLLGGGDAVAIVRRVALRQTSHVLTRIAASRAQPPPAAARTQPPSPVARPSALARRASEGAVSAHPPHMLTARLAPLAAGELAASDAACTAAAAAVNSRRAAPSRSRLERTLPTLHHCLGALSSTLGTLAQAKDLLSTSLKQAAVRAADAAYGPVGGRVTAHGWEVMAEVQRVPARPSSVALLVVSEGLGRIARAGAPNAAAALGHQRREPQVVGVLAADGGGGGGRARADGGADGGAEGEAAAEAADEYALLGQPVLEGRLAQWLDGCWLRSWCCVFDDGVSFLNLSGPRTPAAGGVDAPGGGAEPGGLEASELADIDSLCTIPWAQVVDVRFGGGARDSAAATPPATPPASAASSPVRPGAGSGGGGGGAFDECRRPRAAGPPCAEFAIRFRPAADATAVVERRVCATSAAAAGAWVAAILRLLSRRAVAALVGEVHDELVLRALDGVLDARAERAGSAPPAACDMDSWQLVGIDDGLADAGGPAGRF